MNAGARGCVWILVDGHVDAAHSGLVDQTQSVNASSPVADADDLVMRQVGWQSALFTDRDGFFHTLDHSRGFVAHMRFMHAAVARRDLRQLDNFCGWREGAGHVEEAGAQAERAVFHSLLNQRTHLIELFSGRFTIDVADDRRTN